MCQEAQEAVSRQLGVEENASIPGAAHRFKHAYDLALDSSR